MDAHLRLIANPEVIGSVCDFTYKWCMNAGLDNRESLRFSLAVDELMTNIILFAYPNESGSIHITYKYTLSSAEIIITEIGEPFDPDRHVYDSKKAIEEDSFDGAGLEVIRHMADEFTFINKGKEGKEFRLAKEIREEHILDIIPGLKREPRDEVAPQLEYTVFPITPDDAEDISRLIYRAYGYSYPKEDMYFPKKVERAIERKDKMGTITRTNDNDAVGYFAILRSTDSNIGEVGEAVVSPAHRNRKLMTRMLEALIDMAYEQEMLGLFGTAVTVHEYSQKVNQNFGFKSTALYLAEFDSMDYKGMDDNYPQPISTMIDFLPLYDNRRERLYLPDRYKNLLIELCAIVNIDLDDSEPYISDLPEVSDISLDINYKNKTTLLVVNTYGHDFEEALAEILESLEDNKLNAIYIDLPLDDPSTPRFCDIVKNHRFIFSGLYPLFHNERDYLRLQKIHVELDFDLIVAYTAVGKQIKELVEKEYDENRQKK